MVALLVLLVVPVLEIWAAVVVAQSIGVLPALLALVGLSLLGVLLVRSEGIQVWRRVNAELASGRAPTDSLLDGLMVVIGGALLIVPGFLTAVPGLLLLFPPTRWLLRPLAARWITTRAERSATIGVITFGGSTVAGSTTTGPEFRSSGWRNTSFGRWSGPVVETSGHESTGSTGAGSGSYAEVIDVQVDGSHPDGPPALDPPRPS